MLFKLDSTIGGGCRCVGVCLSVDDSPKTEGRQLSVCGFVEVIVVIMGA